MFGPWKSFIVLLLLHAGLHGLEAAEECLHQGQCLGGNLLKEYLTDSLESCITQGGQVEGAKFVTWKTTKVCQAFSYCQSVDVEAEAVTSSLDCKVRGKAGECVGQIYTAPGEVACKQLCEETPTCAWFTYLEEPQHCLIYADCTSLTTSTSSCLEAVPSASTSTSAQTSSPTTSAPATMNKILYIDSVNGKTTLVSLDGTTANCALEDYPSSGYFKTPAAVTYNNGEVLACGGCYQEDADRCWSFNGSVWSSLPNSNQKHCNFDSPNVLVNDGWWITGQDDLCSRSRSSSTSDIYTGSNWKPGPALPGDEYPQYSCVVNLNTTHTFLIGGYSPVRSDAWLYDWTSQAWTRTGSLIHGRYGHGCVNLDGERILIAGGWDGYDRVYSVEIYDSTQGTWSSQSDLPREIESDYPLLLNWDGQVLALFKGEDQIYQRSEENGEWSVLKGLQLPEAFDGYKDGKAILVPGYWSCNPEE